MNPHDSLIPLLGRGPDPEQLRHVRTIPARVAEHEPWPDWVHADLVAAYGSLGIHEPYRHQVEAADTAHDGHHVVVATGTASGKSLAYQLPALDAIHRSELRVNAEPGKIHDDGAVTLYLSPTKALAADQLNAIRALKLPTVRAETYDARGLPAAGSATTRISFWPTLTCCISASFPTTPGGRGSSGACAT